MNESISVKSKCLRWASVLVMVLLLCGWMGTSLAQEAEIDLNALTQETQKMWQKADELTFVWWIPEEYWQVSFAQDRSVSEAQAEEFINILRPYTLIAVIDGKLGPFGGMTYSKESDIRASVRLRDSQGTLYRPLSEDKIDADTKSFLSMIKPLLVNLIGPMGQNMHFILFPANSKKGQKIANAKKEGSFSVILGERELRWRLPLGSLLPPKICPKCNEKCSGAWKFCPWCGTELPKSVR